VSGPKVSVVICSHNPRADYLARVLGALQAQTLAKSDWELLLIDNASSSRLEGVWDLSWHPNARHIREEELGLTPARLRGIGEARGELLVFVDDDNVLAPNYLEKALAIAESWPMLGACGGTTHGEFEVEPERWMKHLIGLLGIREFSHAVWSNNPDDFHSQPCGAGMCVRHTVAKAYAAQVSRAPWRRTLGRRGQALSSGEDTDMVLTCRDLELGFGNFPQLVLTHLIPARRLTLSYMIALLKSITISTALLRYFRDGVRPQEPHRLRTTARYLLTLMTQGRQSALFYKTSRQAIAEAARVIRRLSLPNTTVGPDIIRGSAQVTDPQRTDKMHAGPS
jgi:glycosyltransferase involved in cell wall biosynthesis